MSVVLRRFTRALGAARSGNAAAARTDISALDDIARSLARRQEPYWARIAEIRRDAAKAWVLFASGDTVGGLSLADTLQVALGAGGAATVLAGSITTWIKTRRVPVILRLRRSDGAVGELLALVADRIRTPDVLRYEAALHGNAGYLIGLDAARQGRPGAG